MGKKRIPIYTLNSFIGEEVNVSGWVNTIRDQKKMQFVILRDSTGMVQAINEKKGNKLDEEISALSPESTVNVSGQVVPNKNVKLNQLEIILDNLEVTSKPMGAIPIDENSSLEYRMDWRHIDLRRPVNRLIFEVQTSAEAALRYYCLDNGFIEIHSPKLVEGATESGAELFQLDYFGKKASLAQSPQFYKQMAMASGFDKVLEIGPVFRANPSFTSRHDTEFTSIDVEISWITSHEEVMEFEERWVQFMMEAVAAKHGEDIKKQYGVDVKVPEVPFPRVTMEEAYQILASRNYHVPKEKDGDLDPKGERTLAQHIKETRGHDFVFVSDYPSKVRPFYHMRYENIPDITKSFDLLMKGLEVTTGAQREHRYDILLNQAIEKKVDPESIKSYFNFFKYGCPPHGGYGFGLTRLLMNLLQVKNVREVTYLYRGPNRLTP